MKGGSHLSNEQEVFSFDLNESLYFEKGQEVSQMLSISLDPEISIQSFNEYVSIRGVIELHGEYERTHTNHDDETESLDFNDHHSRRYLEQINNVEDNLAKFSHRFPVEISVPSYRVANLNDITVNIASFDYEIPEGNQMKLTSTIEIQGISNQTTFPEELNERIENEESSEQLEMPEESFQFELEEELLPDEREQGLERDAVTEEVSQKEVEKEEEADDKDRWKYKQTQTFEEFFKEDDINEALEEEEIISKEAVEHVSADIEVQEDTDAEAERKESYLADLFGGEESNEEVKYEQLRICIVQDQDTLESISERYQVPKLQLLKLNRLADDDLSKGQLLTIPSRQE